MKAHNWIYFKNTFNTDQKGAIWQYFIDHSVIQPNGYYGIMFYIKDLDDFWKRVYDRYTGDFKRYDISEKKSKMKKIDALNSLAETGTVFNNYDTILENNIFTKYIWRLFKYYAKCKYKKKKTSQNTVL